MYTIEIWRSADLADAELLRTHEADEADDVEVVVESLRDAYGSRENVVWTGETVDERGFLHGRNFQDGVNFTILVKPPLAVS